MTDQTSANSGPKTRSKFYAIIPLGFVALVALLILGGWAVEEAPAENAVVDFVEGAEADVN
ncbi:nicotinate phosphoribosyltransferase [Pseudooctadecabacter sp.]|uniref:nicotinate phosphoribosyltransferase n=1 Tax=Pseudooctadecabacter sp. TaxID=1966338 RepID=UPI0035C858CE